ncbi:MAG: dihydropteroate synthase [Candidatus Pacebacteria bacterium]|nr:dihydropteroate synthase [Candidatus Paceibacterota bacterium]
MKSALALSRIKKLQKDHTLIMGILNITPDSFSDGGQYMVPELALAKAESLIKEGADIIDIGGESTRPGALPVSSEEEIARTAPVIRMIREKLGDNVLISIDTNKAIVAEAALTAGADIVNSLGGFTFDTALAKVVAKAKCPFAIYHIKGEPRTMQKGAIKYKNVVGDITAFFKQQIAIGGKAGIKRDQFILDPGIGFGKSVDHNLTIVKNYKAFTKFKLPLMLGASRKSHLANILKEKMRLDMTPPPEERIEAGLAETAIAVLGGATIVRTHDVLATKKFLTLLDALK